MAFAPSASIVFDGHGVLRFEVGADDGGGLDPSSVTRGTGGMEDRLASLRGSLAVQRDG